MVGAVQAVAVLQGGCLGLQGAACVEDVYGGSNVKVHGGLREHKGADVAGFHADGMVGAARTLGWGTGRAGAGGARPQRAGQVGGPSAIGNPAPAIWSSNERLSIAFVRPIQAGLAIVPRAA